MIQCPNCAVLNQPSARFCNRCGTPLIGMQTIALGGMAQGRYQVQRMLGQGGMGAVYQVLDTRLGGKLLAMKEMSDAALLDPAEKAAAIAAFRQEAELLAKLDHSNIPKVSDFFTEGGKHYIIMEFVQGETLEARLARQGAPCSEPEVRAWATQLGEVLAYLHGQNPPVIFRDLKPGNIMVTPQGQVKLIDFGIARFFKPGKTGDTQQMGTPGYASPEQYGQGSGAQTDERSDIYSLGVVLHEALTRYDPASTPFRLPPVRQLNAAISADLEQIVTRATQTNKAMRYRSAAELLQALFAQQPKHTTPPTVVVTPQTQTPFRTKSGVPVLAILAVVVVLLGAGGALAYQFVSKSAPSPTSVPISPTVFVSPTPEPGIEATATRNDGSPTGEPTEELTSVSPSEPMLPTDTATPIPVRPTHTPTVDWQIEAAQAVVDVVTRYGDVKVEALTYLTADRLPELLTGDLLERQRRGVCGLKNTGQYYRYSNRTFRVLEVAFRDRSSARVLAYITEDRVLYNPDGTVRTDYNHEFYPAIYVLERKSDGRWYINCFAALPDDKPTPPIWDIECKIELTRENPCNQ